MIPALAPDPLLSSVGHGLLKTYSGVRSVVAGQAPWGITCPKLFTVNPLVRKQRVEGGHCVIINVLRVGGSDRRSIEAGYAASRPKRLPYM